jgi:hypothetical protein
MSDTRTYWYKVSKHSDTVDTVEVARVNAKTIVVRERYPSLTASRPEVFTEIRAAISSEWATYFQTHEEAKAYLVTRLTRQIKNLQTSLANSEKALRRLSGEATR